jgi:hypothetical protein
MTILSQPLEPASHGHLLDVTKIRRHAEARFYSAV